MKLGKVAAAPLEPEQRSVGRPRKDAEPPIVRPVPAHPPTTRALKNWIFAYQQYTSNLEAPDVFHMWAGLSAIAAVTVRQVYLRFSYGDLFTNIFVGLVGKPATRKTTAIDVAHRLAKKVVPQHTLPSAGSAAALVASLADMKDMPTQAGNLISNELGTLIRQGDTDIVGLLTDLYDCKEDQEKRTISRGKEFLAKPWLNFIFGTTPVWLGANMPSSSAEGGFFSRILFVHSHEIKLTSPRPVDTDENTQLRAALINDLIHINSLKGEFKFTDDGGKFYDDWYMAGGGLSPVSDPRMEGYFARKHVHVLKVAMLLCLSERDDLLLTKMDIEAAVSILGAIEKGISSAVGSVGRNEMLVYSQNVLAQVRNAGSAGIDYQKVLRAHIHNVKKGELDEVIATLIQTQDLRQIREGKVYRLFAVRTA